MDFFRQNKTLWTAIVTILIAFGVYAGFFRGESGGTGLTSEQVTPGVEAGGDLVALLNQLRSLDLDSSIFSSAAFESLQDFSVDLVPEPTGRNNPFAPLGTDGEFGSGSGDMGDLENIEAELDGLDL